MSYIFLPCYEGFDSFSLWPAQDTVTSCYGLLSKSMITSPVLTGRKVLLPLYAGYRYAAHCSRNNEEAGTVTLHMKRPDHLVYHQCCFHVMDIMTCPEISFGSVDEIILARVHEQSSNENTRMSFHTAEMVNKIKFDACLDRTKIHNARIDKNDEIKTFISKVIKKISDNPPSEGLVKQPFDVDEMEIKSTVLVMNESNLRLKRTRKMEKIFVRKSDSFFKIKRLAKMTNLNDLQKKLMNVGKNMMKEYTTIYQKPGGWNNELESSGNIKKPSYLNKDIQNIAKMRMPGNCSIEMKGTNKKNKIDNHDEMLQDSCMMNKPNNLNMQLRDDELTMKSDDFDGEIKDNNKMKKTSDLHMKINNNDKIQDQGHLDVKNYSSSQSVSKQRSARKNMAESVPEKITSSLDMQCTSRLSPIDKWIQVGCSYEKKNIIGTNDGIKMLVKPAHYNLLNLRNKFSSLDEEEELNVVYLSRNKDVQIIDEMFTIGRRNIFRQGKVKRLKEEYENQELFKNDFWKCDIELTIFEDEIKSRRTLKKCRTCSFKKRQCVSNPSKCKALNLHCFFCNKPGHFPKSLCCKKRRIVQHKSKDKVDIKSVSSNDHHITKKNMKLIKKRIKKLEIEHRRKGIVELAEKCAEQLKDGKYENKLNKLSKYCIKKLQKLLKTSHIPNEEELKRIHDILKVFDHMFYSRTENEYVLHSDKITDVISHSEHVHGEAVGCFEENQNSINQGKSLKDEVKNSVDVDCEDFKMKEKLKEYEDEIFYSDCGESVCDVDEIFKLDKISGEELSNHGNNLTGFHDISMPQIDGIENKIIKHNSTRTDYKDEQFLCDCIESNEISNYVKKCIEVESFLIPQVDGLEDDMINDDMILPDQEDELRFANGRESVVFKINQQDGINYDKFTRKNMELFQDLMIPQLDGFDDENINDRDIVDTRVFAINCEEIQIISLINFFRSFDLLWKDNEEHPLCEAKKNCFFCHMRSSVLRLNTERKKGPKSLKINEAVSQLNQFQERIQIHWRELKVDLPRFCQNTINLLMNEDTDMKANFGLPNGQCQKCNTALKNPAEILYEVDTKDMMYRDMVSMNYVLNLLISKETKKDCCFKTFKFEDVREKIALLFFSHPVNMKMSNKEIIGGKKVIYRSHFEEKDGQLFSRFGFEDKIFHQSSNGNVYQSKSEVQYKVKMLAVQFGSKDPNIWDTSECYVYEKKVQLSLHKKYLSVISPDKHKIKALHQRDYERHRNQSDERKMMFRSRDKVRDQTDERKKMHKDIEKTAKRRARDQTEQRIKMHSAIDKMRDQTDERKKMHGDIDKIRDQTDERIKMHKDIEKTAKRRARDQTEQRIEMHSAIDKIRDQTDERIKMHKDIEKTAKRRARDQTEQRIKMHKIIEKTPKRRARDQTEQRIKMHKDIEKTPQRRARDTTEKRRIMHSKIDKKRNQTAKRKKMFADYEQKDTRKYYVKNRDDTKIQNSLISSLSTDTGFDVICSSCLQYKCKQYCKLICTLDEEKIKKYIVKDCALLKNRSMNQFVCNLCFRDIKKDIFPKRSHKNKFKFANFPDSLIKTLKRKCRFEENKSGSKLILDDENYERRQMQLNKLEAHLLKLCIPFIRIAHCPRGRYFKVKGDLILISSDIGHSLSKILPIQQSLIPVSFKRKLSYTGAYIEEYVEKEKLKIYFSWLKRHNHLFKNVELDTSMIEDFESESLSKADEVMEKDQTETACSNSEGEGETDFLVDYFNQEPFNPVKEGGDEVSFGKTTMFLNKYCEDPEIPSVANKLADAIVDYEIMRQIPIENEDDFEIDEEIITEEQYLDEIEEPLQDISASHGHVKDELHDQFDSFDNPTEGQAKILSNIASKRAEEITKKMETISVAPGESGSFQNWGKELFLEERCFPEKFPFGTGGYLSSCVDNPENEIGFANYCINQILSCDPKFRNDPTYLFFLLLVKELIQMKRCKSTYFRQATRLPNLSRNDVINMDPENISRFNRSYQVFKSLRGTSMYYEQSKKNLMASLRQHGCPSIFLTLSCAEFDWPELLKEILETVYRKKVSQKDIDDLSIAEKNRLISENVVQSTMHFQKRIDKIFSLLKYDFFKGSTKTYHASSYFYRIEFQQRGAPHAHSLVWLKDQDDNDAPNFWDENKGDQDSTRMQKVEEFADFLISTSPEDMFCEKHEHQKHNSINDQNCNECIFLREKVQKYQSHKHTFTCKKKGKTITVKENEGYGRLDNIKKGNALSNIEVCRFKFPKFPMDETKLICGISKDTEEHVVKSRKKDLNKIMKYLIRQTYTDQDINELQSWNRLKEMNFWDFLYEVGMFSNEKLLHELNDEDKIKAKEKYLSAISASVQGSAAVFLKREVKNIFFNGYNPKLMRIHRANHDLQICIDQYSCAQYICGYLTKNESGMSKLLKAVNEETNNLKQVDKLNALAAVLDKHREVSIQEAIYRLLGLPMTKSSVLVKYLSTVHPHFRDGLLKGNMEGLDANEAIFHNSPHDYYENRPEQSDQKGVRYKPEELEKDYWMNMSLADFWSEYDIVYTKIDQEASNLIKLQNDKGYIRKRVKSKAILRYYLNYSNDEDLARGLLILFLPFRDEMRDIHQKDVKKLLSEKGDIIEEKRGKFEKYKVMADLISNIQTDVEKNDADDEEPDNFEDEETTDPKDINDFEKWARSQASKDLSKFNDLTRLSDINDLRSKISSLNKQQRLLFDDFSERMASIDVDEKPVYLFLAGEAGTGKSHLVRVLIEAVKILKIKAGDELSKPPLVVVAPTANAAFLIGGKTVDSALGFFRMQNNQYSQAQPSKMSMMQFQYDEVKVIFCDEISMVGSAKLAKINYRLQDLAEGGEKNTFMGGKSFVASGDLWQLPPIKDSMVFERNKLDGRPACAQSHWKENFRIYYLTEKMRCQNDPHFSNLCDRVARGKQTDEDEIFLRSRIKPCESENDNENFKLGKLSIIVTTNPKRNIVNSEKLIQLIPYEKEYSCDSIDRITNLPSGHKVPERLKTNPGRTGNLETELRLKVGAPVVITTNHSKQKYKDDGIMNGARGFVQSITVAKENPEKVDIIWIVFKNESIGKRYRFDHSYLLKDHNPGHKMATPIFPTRQTFTEEFGSVEYQRTNFPLSLAYALTAHKCQGDTLEEVIIDFGVDVERKITNYICPGSFYVSLTRVREGSKVFLKSFDRSYIKVKESIEENVDAMRKFKPYLLKKVYLDEQVFEADDTEIKVGYLNINGLSDADHAKYINSDHNLKNLDILVLSETKLDKNDISTKAIEDLQDWSIFGRYDSADGKKHMGLLLMLNMNLTLKDEINDVMHQVIKRQENLQIQGLIINLNNGLSLGFVYCRSNPNNSEIKAIKNYFANCDAIMGDFNLSHRNEQDVEKIKSLCGEERISALTEITRSQSNNQLDYILIKKGIMESCFVTSYHNFISDHKAITLRINRDENPILDQIKERTTFDQESHLKQNNRNNCEDMDFRHSEDDSQSSEDSEDISSQEMKDCYSMPEDNQSFTRRIMNPDMATCWLNSCLQLVLTAMDQKSGDIQFNSELGAELIRLKMNESGGPLDPTGIKNIIVACEDTRIAMRLSQLQSEIFHPDELERQSRLVQSLRLDLSRGQQCVRDFFVALSENLINWPDVFTIFSFEMITSTTCPLCKKRSQSESLHIYEELDVPKDQSNAKISIEQFFNGSYTVDSKCSYGCKEAGQGERRNTLKSCRKSEFIILIFSRAIESEHGYQLNENRVSSTDPVFIRDSEEYEAVYNPISIIEFQGRITSSGQSAGHYICDVQEQESNMWFRTNDNNSPFRINPDQVSKKAYVVLLKRSNE